MGTVSASVEKLADEFAREAMADPEFRRAVREMVHRWGEQLWERLLSEERKARKRRRKPRRRKA